MRLRIVFAAVVLPFLTGCRPAVPPVTVDGAPAEVHYSPAENLERIDAGLLREASRFIDFAAYSLTDLPVAEALMDAARRGVHVRIYRDNVQSQGEQARAAKVSRRKKMDDDDEGGIDTNDLMSRLAGTPNVEIRIKKSKTLMHLKSYAIDRKLVRSGSANFSPTGEKRQDNDLIVMRDAASVARFESNFDAAWNRMDNETVTP